MITWSVVGRGRLLHFAYVFGTWMSGSWADTFSAIDTIAFMSATGTFSEKERRRQVPHSFVATMSQQPSLNKVNWLTYLPWRNDGAIRSRLLPFARTKGPWSCLSSNFSSIVLILIATFNLSSCTLVYGLSIGGCWNHTYGQVPKSDNQVLHCTWYHPEEWRAVCPTLLKSGERIPGLKREGRAPRHRILGFTLR